MKTRYLVLTGVGLIITFIFCLSIENNRKVYYMHDERNLDLSQIDHNSNYARFVSNAYDYTTTNPLLEEEHEHSNLKQYLQTKVELLSANRSRNVMATNASHVLMKPSVDIIKSHNQLEHLYSSEQKQRIETIKRVCKDKDLFRHNIYRGQNSTRYYYSQTYGFSYCKVPKSGSTFWTQAFHVLENGVKNSGKVFTKARAGVHGMMGKFIVNFKGKLRRQSMSVLVSRDPFTRLYSAFIDKSYLNLNRNVNQEIMHLRSPWKRRFCAIDVTFQEFLDFIVHKVVRGQTLNRHWAPIYNLCRPCDVNPYILVKQESFSRDMEQALKAFSVPTEKLDTILSALHENRIETTIPGIIRTVINKNNVKTRGTCLFGQELMKRMWTAFQIQGFLKETLKFPSRLFNNKLQYDDTLYVTEVILTSINRNKMTSSEMKRQRHKSLVSAYSKIRNETLEQIIDIYKLDFYMFNYSTTVPHD